MRFIFDPYFKHDFFDFEFYLNILFLYLITNIFINNSIFYSHQLNIKYTSFINLNIQNSIYLQYVIFYSFLTNKIYK